MGTFFKGCLSNETNIGERNLCRAAMVGLKEDNQHGTTLEPGAEKCLQSYRSS